MSDLCQLAREWDRTHQLPLARVSFNCLLFPQASFPIPVTLEQWRLETNTISLYNHRSTMSTSCSFLLAFGTLEAVFRSVIPVFLLFLISTAKGMGVQLRKEARVQTRNSRFASG